MYASKQFQKLLENTFFTQIQIIVQVVSVPGSFEVPITAQLLSNATIGDFLIIAESPEIDLRLAAKSYTHSQGGGNYFLACCDNQLLEKFIDGQYFVGVQDGTVNSTPKDKGALTITNINLSGYSGAFTFIGQNAVGEEKEFTGKFKVVY